MTAPLQITIPGVEPTEYPTVDQHVALAYGHSVAAVIAALIGNDYDRRTIVGVALTNGGTDIALSFRRQGKDAPDAETLNAYALAAMNAVHDQRLVGA